MKQRGSYAMQSSYQDSRYGLHLDELTDLDAWEGYEFWAAQLEAEIEHLSDFGQVGAAQLRQAEPVERKSDVFPF
jgi:hypothetical protein